MLKTRLPIITIGPKRNDDDIIITAEPKEAFVKLKVHLTSDFMQVCYDFRKFDVNAQIKLVRMLKYLNTKYFDETNTIQIIVMSVTEVKDKNEQAKIIRDYHGPENRHLGISKTYERISQKFYWEKVQIQRIILTSRRPASPL